MKLLLAILAMAVLAGCAGKPLVEVESDSCKDNAGHLICIKVKDL